MNSDKAYSQGGRGNTVLYGQSFICVHALTYNLTASQVVVPSYVALWQGQKWPELCTPQSFSTSDHSGQVKGGMSCNP